MINTRLLSTQVHTKTGYALVTLLVFMTTAMIVTSAAVVVIVTNMKASTTYVASEEALILADTGADGAILRLLRDHSYAGETLSIGNGQVTTTVSGEGTKTVVSEATVGSVKRRVQVIGSFSNTVFTVSSWREIE